MLVNIFFEPTSNSPWQLWMLAGLLVGLGMLAKYHAIFLAFGSFAFMLTTKERRSMLLTVGPHGLFHWQAPGYLLAVPLLGRVVAGWVEGNSRITRIWLTASVTTFLLIVTILGSHTATGWLRQVEPQWFKKGDPTTEALDWRDLPEFLTEQGLFASQAEFVVAVHWIDAGKIDYVLGDKFPVLCLNSEPHHFAFMHNLADFQGKDALIIGRKKRIGNALTMYQPYFTTIEPVGTIPIKRAGIPEFDVIVFYAKGFTGSFPLPYR